MTPDHSMIVQAIRRSGADGIASVSKGDSELLRGSVHEILFGQARFGPPHEIADHALCALHTGEALGELSDEQLADEWVAAVRARIGAAHSKVFLDAWAE